jgi:hypothetical protein
LKDSLKNGNPVDNKMEKIAEIIYKSIWLSIFIWFICIQIENFIIWQNGKMIKAKIVDYATGGGGSKTGSYVYLFSLDSNIYRGSFGDPFFSNISIGDSITILYLEKNPKINNPAYFAPPIFNNKKFKHEFKKPRNKNK